MYYDWANWIGRRERSAKRKETSLDRLLAFIDKVEQTTKNKRLDKFCKSKKPEYVGLELT